MTDQPVNMIGPYRFIEHIGQGPLGHVARSEDTRTGQPVALKLLHQKLANKPDARQQFQRQTAAMQAARHPHLTAPLDAGEFNGVPYRVMPYLGGVLVNAINPAQAAALLHPLTEALQVLEQQNQVHGNIKPTNVLFDGEGKPYLTDMNGLPATQQALTADSTALAAVVYQWLTGQPFQPGITFDDIPEGTATILKRALHPSPPARYPDVKSFVNDFELAVNSVPRVARVPNTPAQAAKPRRSPLPGLLLTLFLLLVIAGGGYFVYTEGIPALGVAPLSESVAAAPTQTEEVAPVTEQVTEAVTEDAPAVTEDVAAVTAEAAVAVEASLTEEVTPTEVLSVTPTNAAPADPSPAVPSASGPDTARQTQIAHGQATRTAIAANGVVADDPTTPPTADAGDTDAPTTPALATATRQPTSPPPQPATATPQPVLVTVATRDGTNANVRTSNDTNAPVIGVLPSQSQVRALAVSVDGWYQIELEGGELGWISPVLIVAVEGNESTLETLDP